MTRYVVVGAGVVGLTNALSLLRADPTNEVTIVAQHFPTDFDVTNVYTSPIAGANWESFASDEDTFVQGIDLIGYRKFQEYIRERPEAGVTERKNLNLVTRERYVKDGHIKQIPWFCKGEFAKEFKFRELNESEFDTEKFAYGFEYDGMVIRTSYYMTFLLNECWRESGAAEGPRARFSLKRDTINRLRDAFAMNGCGSQQRADYVINCTGLQARSLEDITKGEQDKMYPVRGVVYVAKNNVGMEKITVVETELSDEALYIMPRREGELIIGGCFQVGNESREVDDTLGERILGRCQQYLPEFPWEKLEIVRRQVGFRPFRKGGYRIEREGRVVHCYGMGGAGFQSSWGCAARVGELLASAKRGESRL